MLVFFLPFGLSERGSVGEQKLMTALIVSPCPPHPPTPCPSALRRADSLRSLWSPYLLTMSLPLMTLKPLFSLKRVCLVPVSGEEAERRLDIVRITWRFQGDTPPLSFTLVFIIHSLSGAKVKRINKIWWKRRGRRGEEGAHR